jgi:hypothetical protein
MGMVRRTALAALAMVMLAGCHAKEKREAAFMPKCVAANFTREQCTFLFALVEQARSDSDSADAMGSVALGLSAMPRR